MHFHMNSVGQFCHSYTVELYLFMLFSTRSVCLSLGYNFSILLCFSLTLDCEFLLKYKHVEGVGNSLSLRGRAIHQSKNKNERYQNDENRVCMYSTVHTQIISKIT